MKRQEKHHPTNEICFHCKRFKVNGKMLKLCWKCLEKPFSHFIYKGEPNWITSCLCGSTSFIMSELTDPFVRCEHCDMHLDKKYLLIDKIYPYYRICTKWTDKEWKEFMKELKKKHNTNSDIK